MHPLLAGFAKVCFGYKLVIGHAMATVQLLNDNTKMNRHKISDKPCLPSCAKSKEKQRHPQANPKLLHICLYPNARKNIHF